MKRVLIVVICSLFLFCSCQPKYSTEYKYEPDKFPGEKYSTFFDSNQHPHFEEAYSPNTHTGTDQVYFLKEPNLYSKERTHYSFFWENNEYTGELYRIVHVTSIPYVILNYENYSVEVWLDNGETKSFTNEYYQKDRPKDVITTEELLTKANEIASKYIDVDKYETSINWSTWKVTYIQVIEGFKLENDKCFSVSFGLDEGDNIVLSRINFDRYVDDSFNFDVNLLDTAIKEKIQQFAYDASNCVINEINHQLFDVTNYDIPFMKSRVTLHNVEKNNTEYYTIYTKLSD